MHNKKKLDLPRSQAELDAVAKKVISYSSLASEVMRRKIARDLSSDALDLTGNLLKLNPDFQSIWNYRRFILLNLHGHIGITDSVPIVPIDSVDANILRESELSISTAGIKKNSKCYGAWYHRQWIIERLKTNIDSELELCKEFLRLDQRNFHCWNYRRYLVRIGDISHSAEFSFSTEKIEENFSNYSAFHHRSVFISSLTMNAVEVLGQETSILENGIALHII